MSSNVFLINGGGGPEIGGSRHNYYVHGTSFGIDCGLRPEVRETDVLPIRLKNKKLEDFIAQESCKPRKDPLPDLTILPGMKDLFLSHGHIDHIGAVPYITNRNKNMILRGTEATLRLCDLQWHESIEIAERRKEVLPFQKSDVEYALSRFVVIHHGQEIKLNDKVSVMPIEAGHILGAVSYLIFFNGKLIGLHSGDISCCSQRTVPGASEVSTDGLKFMVIDSTRLTEKNPPREEVEEACIKAVRQAHESGKYIRANTFAIGRTQETYALFREACPNAEIWVDGATGREVSKLYVQLGATGIDGISNCFVRDQEHRRQIINNPKPNIVLTPSAMSFGGTSIQYLKHGIIKSDHLFISMGYLDPCSPEYAFFESEKLDVFRIQEKDYPRFCHVARYNATAHCDGHDILEMKRRMNPGKVVTVHGDGNKMDRFIEDHPGEGFVKGENYVEIPLD